MTRRPTPRRAKKAAASKPAKPPKIKAGWVTFLTAHPSLYTAAFGKRTPMPVGVTLTAAVKASLKGLVNGAWETQTLKQGGATLVLVGFADKADFDAVKAHFNGQPWRSTIPGSIDGFQYMLP